jgi:small-conductance mechanosensitive channel
VVLIGAVFLFLVRVQGLALGASPSLGIVLAAVAAGLIAVAALVLRPRIPERNPQDSPEAYWTAVTSRGAAIILWAATEGAVLLGWVGYLLTSQTLPAAVAVFATVVLAWYRPSGLAGAA